MRNVRRMCVYMHVSVYLRQYQRKTMAMTVICIVGGIGNAVVGSVDELAIHNFFSKHVRRTDSFVYI